MWFWRFQIGTFKSVNGRRSTIPNFGDLSGNCRVPGDLGVWRRDTHAADKMRMHTHTVTHYFFENCAFINFENSEKCWKKLENSIQSNHTPAIEFFSIFQWSVSRGYAFQFSLHVCCSFHRQCCGGCCTYRFRCCYCFSVVVVVVDVVLLLF